VKDSDMTSYQHIEDRLIPLDNLPLGVLVLRRDFTVAYWNAQIEEWTGIQRRDIIGKDIAERYPHLAQSRYADRIAPLFDGGPSAIFSSQLHQHFIPTTFPNGRRRVQHTTVTPLAVGDEIHALISVQDVTDLTRLAQDARALHDQALREIEERKRAEGQLRLAASVFASTSEGIFVTDANGTILSVNPAFERITGYSAAEAVGNTPRMLKSGRHDQNFYAHIWSRILSEGTWKGEVWDKRKNGEIYPQDMTVGAIRDENGFIRQFAAIISDITERKEMEEKLRFLSMRDGLTGLYNRRTLDEELANEWRRAVRAPAPFSMILLDIDYFKLFNDTYGHIEGDACLKGVAKTVGCSVRRTGDVTTRYGGEEFAVLLPMTPAVDAARIAETIRASVERQAIRHETSKVSSVVTVSIGVGTITPNHEISADTIVKLADTALYTAKAGGRNRVVSLSE
jgi:diguanylate cyclase (GGDEF)-like protein/PAS domain S-box-containing protein